MKLPPGYPEILTLIASTIDERLRERGIAEEDAAAIAFDATEDVRFAIGGSNPYIPKWIDGIISQRDRDMYAMYDGRNIATIARQFDTTERNAYRAIQRARTAAIKERQGELAL